MIGRDEGLGNVTASDISVRGGCGRCKRAHEGFACGDEGSAVLDEHSCVGIESARIWGYSGAGGIAEEAVSRPQGAFVAPEVSKIPGGKLGGGKIKVVAASA